MAKASQTVIKKTTKTTRKTMIGGSKGGKTCPTCHKPL